MASKATDLGNFQKLSPGLFLLRRDGASGQAAGEHSKDPTLVMVLGWMGGQFPHLFKFTQHYEALYPHATIILTLSHPSFFFKNSSDRKAMISPLADLLENLGYINPETISPGSSILVHAFSGGGVAQIITLSEILKDRAVNFTHNHKDGYDVPSALILDSAPISSSVGRVVASFAVPIRSPFIRYPAIFIVFLIYAPSALFYTILGLERPTDRRNRMLQCSRILPWISKASPRLYIYSKGDALVPHANVTRHAAEARSLGYTVFTEVFDKSKHVLHMRSDPDRYWAAVIRLWRTALGKAEARL